MIYSQPRSEKRSFFVPVISSVASVSVYKCWSSEVYASVFEIHRVSYSYMSPSWLTIPSDLVRLIDPVAPAQGSILTHE